MDAARKEIGRRALDAGLTTQLAESAETSECLDKLDLSNVNVGNHVVLPQRAAWEALQKSLGSILENASQEFKTTNKINLSKLEARFRRARAAVSAVGHQVWRANVAPLFTTMGLILIDVEVGLGELNNLVTNLNAAAGLKI